MPCLKVLKKQISRKIKQFHTIIQDTKDLNTKTKITSNKKRSFRQEIAHVKKSRHQKVYLPTSLSGIVFVSCLMP